MRNDSAILAEALNLLNQKMNVAEIERFIMLLNSQGFDYTKWRENLWSEKETLESLSRKAQVYHTKQF